MAVTAIDIESIRGDFLDVTLDFEGFDLTGKSVKAQLKKAPGQATPNLEFTDGDSSLVVDIIDTSNATIQFVKTSTEMAVLDVGQYYIDIQMFTDVDDVKTIGKGIFKIVQDITT